MSTPPVSPGENEMFSPSDILSLPKITPSTIPIAIGKKSVSDRSLALLPIMQANPLSPSFSPTTMSLSPNLSSRFSDGVRSIPLRRTRVTVHPKFWWSRSSRSCLPTTFLLVRSSDCMSCVSANGSSPSSRSPSRSSACERASFVPTHCTQSFWLSWVIPIGMRMCPFDFILEIMAPVMLEKRSSARVFPNTASLVTLNRHVSISGNLLLRSASSVRASFSRSTRMILGSSLTKSITPMTPNG